MRGAMRLQAGLPAHLAIQRDIVRALQKRGEQNFHVQTRQIVAKADMRAGAEGQMDIRLADNVEAVRLIEGVAVAIGEGDRAIVAAAGTRESEASAPIKRAAIPADASVFALEGAGAERQDQGVAMTGRRVGLGLDRRRLVDHPRVVQEQQ